MKNSLQNITLLVMFLFLVMNFAVLFIEKYSIIKNTQYHDKVSIVMIADDQYAMPTAVALTSVFQNKKETTDLNVYIITHNLSSKNKNLLSRTKAKLIEHQMPIQLIDKKHLYVSNVALSKFDLPNILINENKVLYLDSDIIVQGDLAELFNFDLKDRYAAVVKDMPAFQWDYHKKVGLKQYFNSGVMLLNLKKMRAENITPKLIDYKLNKDLGRFMDQDALNIVFNENVVFIHPKYNWMISLAKFDYETIREFFGLKEIINIENAVILHQTGREKAWNNKEVLGYNLWEKYYKQSPFKYIKLHNSKKSVDRGSSYFWLVFALLASITSAFYHLSTQNLKINANAFMVYRGWFLVILLLPFLIGFSVYSSSFPPFKFYLMSVLQGACVAYMDYLAFRVNKNYGAETVSSIMPASVIIIFLMWCIIEPSSIISFFDKPLQAYCILFSLFGVTMALLNYRRTHLTRKAILILIPVLFLSSSISILNKLIMTYSTENKLLSACWRAWIVSLIIGIIHLRLYLKKGYNFRQLFDFNMLKKSFVFILMLMLMIFKSLAMFYTDNPAYVSCIVYIALIWIMLLSRYIPSLKFCHSKALTQKKWELLFIVSVILLILNTH